MDQPELRGAALALRDLCEIAGADEGTLALPGGTLTYSADDGCHLVPLEGEPLDLTVWIGAGQHALGCSIFANDRSSCCDARVRYQPDHGDGTVLVICSRCDYQCRVRPDAALEGTDG